MKVMELLVASLAFMFLFPALVIPSERTDFIVKIGIMEPESQNRSYLIETNKVTMDPSRNPGFCFLVDPPNDKPYQIYSIHYLPQKPESLKGEFKRYNLAKATQGIKTIEKHVKGIRSFCFDFHAGDPLGKYQIKIFINKILNSIVELEAISIKNPLTKELQ